jgi:SWI/SNF-related matrix-associated actin-dependent regulator of chromatin subfamily A-like protein 1
MSVWRHRLIAGIPSYMKSDIGIHIYTHGSAYRILDSICKPKKQIISTDKASGLPTWKVMVFSIYPWMFNSLIHAVPELKDACNEIMSRINNKTNNQYPQYCTNNKWFPYQKAGVEWLLKNKGGMVCDEMGLGKTIQAIGFIDNSPYNYSIIISPASMLFTWKEEIEKWSSWNGVVLDGKKQINKALKKDTTEWNEKTAFIMSWGAIALHFEKIMEWNIPLDVMICDESHYAKGIDAKRTHAVMVLSKLVSSTVLLTGTPMRNCAIDLFPQLHMVSPSSFPDFHEYSEEYSPPRQRTFGRSTFTVYDQSTNLTKLREEVKPYMIFRKKKDVLRDLPPKRYRRINMEAEAHLEEQWKDIMERARTGGEIDSAELISHRQAVGLFKAQHIVNWIQDNSDENHPVVVFLVHRETRRVLENELKGLGITVKCIVGDTPNKKRKDIISEFQSRKIQVLICSEAGKEGITLTRSSSLVQLERFWVPADEEQAEARIWRIGQKNPVIISHAHMGGTIDDFIVGKLIRKRNIIQEVFSDHQMDNNTFNILDRMLTDLI